MLEVTLTALKLTDQLPRKQCDDRTVLYFFHLTYEFLVVFLYPKLLIVI